MNPISHLRRILMIAGGSLLAISSASAQSTSNTWNTDADGNWTSAANWLGDAAYAEGADNTATFGDFITNNRTITLNAAITIGNINATDITHNYTISGANILTLDLTTGTPTINVSNGSATRTLTISSVLAGNDGLNKTGPGTLALSGANTYTGTTTISQGILNLGNGGSTGSLASTALALGGGTLSYTRTGSQTQNFSTTAINAGNSSVSTVAGNTLGLGAITQSAGGTLNVGTAGTITTSNSNVNNILGAWAFYNTGTATTYAKVSGSNISGLGYTGGTDGTAVLTAAALSTDATGNFSFTGGAGALGGNSFNTLRYTGATGAMTGAFTVNGIMNAGAGTLTFSNAVTIGSTNQLVVNAASNNIIFSSAIGENATASFTKIGTGSVTLSGNNTYTGLTVVGAGTLTVNHNNALGSSTGVNSHTILAAVTGSASPRISVNSNITTAENITITGETENGSYFSPLTAAGSGASQGTYSGTITLAGSGAIRIGPANWTGTITQSGTSHRLIFVGATNTVSNAMTINGADVTIGEGTTTLNAVNGSGIGNTDIYAFSGTTTLRLGVTDAIRTDRDLTFSNSSTGITRLDLNGKDQTIRGLINATGTTRTVNNDASGTNSTLTVGNGGGDYSFAGTIINNTTGTGTVALVKTGTGNQTLTGTNTYTGGTRIDDGTLTLGHATDTLANTGAINVNGGTLALGVNSDTVGAVTLTSGSISGSTGVLTGSSYAVQSGSVSAIFGGTGIALTKTTGGTVTLSGTNTYTGATNVSNGTLIVNGSISNSSLTTVASGATIGGSGTVGALTVSSGGFINPGNSPGILTVSGNYVQAGTYNAEINGLTPGTGHDQINVTGTVNIAGGSLTALFSGLATYSANDLIFILLNDGTDAITGTYTGLAQGATVTSHGGFDWQISYVANNTGVGTGTFTGGNDIALIAVIPEPSVVLLSSLGVLLLFRRRR